MTAEHLVNPEVKQEAELAVDELRLRSLADCAPETYEGRGIATYGAAVSEEVTQRRTASWLRYVQERITIGQTEAYGIYDDTNTLVGDVAVSGLRHRHPAMSYRLAADSRGRGYASRSVRAVAAHVFETYAGVEAIELVIHQDNAPSRRVAERVGAQRQATSEGVGWEMWRIAR
ncbi:MAG TPA: GNAT family N-acetyltransferase [Candidatus Saccharimonadales bacterium]|nr:GNAT family N-acetyltransferase [Candidatus Saccharimonadales bacterium]